MVPIGVVKKKDVPWTPRSKIRLNTYKIGY
jgi:hypothetical protein